MAVCHSQPPPPLGVAVAAVTGGCPPELGRHLNRRIAPAAERAGAIATFIQHTNAARK